MTPDSQSIASLEEFASTFITDNMPQRDMRRIVSRVKKMYDDLQAHLYIC